MGSVGGLELELDQKLELETRLGLELDAFALNPLLLNDDPTHPTYLVHLTYLTHLGAMMT